MKRFSLTSKALRDLQDIWEFLSKDSFDHADRCLEDFYAAFNQLAGMPGIGHRRPDLTGKDVLFWKVHSFLVIYRRVSDPLMVVAILHGKRDVRKILRQR